MSKDEEKLMNEFIEILQKDKKALLEILKLLSVYLKSTGKIK